MKQFDLSDLQSLGGNVVITITGNDLIDLFNEFKEQSKPVEKEDKLLTPEEVADKLKVDVVTLWRWKKKKLLIPSKLGNMVRYKQSDVERFIEEN